MPEPADNPVSKRASAMADELRVVMSRLRRRTREARPGGYNSSQLLALSRLEREGPATVTALAKAEGVRPQSMGATGLLVRTPDPSDRRQTILSLTPAAMVLINSYRVARNDWLFRAITTRLTAPEVDQLERSLELFAKLLE
jgi:DNA-binding MarR family transcriptional regulator